MDRKVFNVDADLTAAGASASELLENIPSVDVDMDGNVSLRGNSSVSIWINGRDAGITSDNVADVLEQIPAESIQRVEIITNPSAKYSPEGTAGVINIVLKRGSMMGYYGSARVGANSKGGFNANGNINMNADKWDTSFSIGYRHGKGDRNNMSRRTYDDGTYLNSDKESSNTRNGVFLRGAATYYYNAKNQAYFNGFGMFGKSNGDGTTLYDVTHPGETLRSQASRDNGKNRGGNATFGYKHLFTDTHTLDLSASINGWNGPRDSYMGNVYEKENNQGVAEREEEWQLQSTEIRVRNIEYQADYVKPIGNGYKLEAGFKGTNSHENSPLETYNGLTDIKADMTLDADLYNRFIYDQNIQALYATFGGKAGNLSFQGGLRGEIWQVRTRSLGYGQTEADVEPFKKNRAQLFPSAFISYSFPRQNEMQVNYTRRIRRPWGGQLNSFQNTSDPTNISYGNPQLAPEYSNSFELNYIKTWEKHMATVSGYYRTTDNVIQRINFINENTGVMNSTFDNVSQSVSTGAEFVIKNNFFDVVDLTTTANVFYYKLDGFSFRPANSSQIVTGDGDSNFTWNIRAMANVSLPWGLGLQVNGGYNAPMVVAQGRQSANYVMDAGLNKSFGKWTINFNVRDLLDSRKRESTTYGNGYTQFSRGWGSGRRFQISLSYSFGNMKPKMEEGRGPRHDDGGPGMDD